MLKRPTQTLTQASIGIAQSFSRVRLYVTPRIAGRQAPLSVGFSRQEYWSGVPFLPPGDLPNAGIKPTSLRIAGWVLHP